MPHESTLGDLTFAAFVILMVIVAVWVLAVRNRRLTSDDVEEPMSELPRGWERRQ
jgi:hypothetical protein